MPYQLKKGERVLVTCDAKGAILSAHPYFSPVVIPAITMSPRRLFRALVVVPEIAGKVVPLDEIPAKLKMKGGALVTGS